MQLVFHVTNFFEIIINEFISNSSPLNLHLPTKSEGLPVNIIKRKMFHEKICLIISKISLKISSYVSLYLN